jgi:putative glycosyltransferase (TIGR04348 family)
MEHHVAAHPHPSPLKSARRLGVAEVRTEPPRVRILIVTPAPPGTRLGNRVTALRWRGILRALGQRASVAESWSGEDCELLVALHAGKSAAAVRAFRARHPGARIVVALTGTDVYAEGGLDARAHASLERADRIVVLQAEALRALDPRQRRKARVILQSAERYRGRVGHRADRSDRRSAQRADRFGVVAVGHLRPVKDPLLAAQAVGLLPPESRVQIEHYGSSLDAKLAARARRAAKDDPRWRWRGERSPAQIMKILAGARAFVQTSRAEGGSSALAEAIVSRLPILATRIPGAIGMLGAGHRGFFEPGDAHGLARLLVRCEEDARFRRDLARASARRAPLFAPARERAAWRSLLCEVAGG